MWRRGRPAAFDVTVVSPLQAAFVNRPGQALPSAESRKRSQHELPCHSQGIDFFPLGVETLGGWSETAVEQLGALASFLPRGDGSLPTARHLFQRLAVTLQRGNAALWAKRAVPPPPCVDGIS